MGLNPAQAPVSHRRGPSSRPVIPRVAPGHVFFPETFRFPVSVLDQCIWGMGTVPVGGLVPQRKNSTE